MCMTHRVYKLTKWQISQFPPFRMSFFNAQTVLYESICNPLQDLGPLPISTDLTSRKFCLILSSNWIDAVPALDEVKLICLKLIMVILLWRLLLLYSQEIWFYFWVKHFFLFVLLELAVFGLFTVYNLTLISTASKTLTLFCLSCGSTGSTSVNQMMS